LNSAPSADSTASAPAPHPQGVSVIIPAYNYAQYLESAVRSALAQTHRPIEVIIVDDGSTDATPELGARLARELPFVRYFRQQNAGLSAARNTGIGLASHPFVTFLDCDDEFFPLMVETLMRAFDTRPPGTGLIACATLRMDREGRPIGEKRVLPRGSRPYTAADILIKTRFPCCVLARRSCFDSAGLFDPALRSSEDRDMWIRIGLHHPIYFVNQPLVRIRRHDSNMSRDAARMRTAMRHVRRKAFQARVVPLTHLGYWLRVFAIDHFQGGWMYWDEGRSLRALLHAILSLALWPLPLDHRDLQEPRFFRLRAAGRFLLLGLFHHSKV
jgi:glycosyltransferase involved in cell wall biosynthesis